MYNHGESAGRGRGYSSQPLDLWESRPGKPAMRSRIKPDPISGCYKLHVRSIPRSWTENTMRGVFNRVGYPTSVFLNTGGNFHLNWGFVEYETFEEAANAIREFNNNIVLDYIEVSFARERVTDEESYLDQLEDATFDFLNRPSTPSAHDRSVPHIAKSSSSIAEKDTQIPDIKMFSKIIKNPTALGTNLPLKPWRKLPDQSEEITLIENAIFNRILSIYKNLEGFANCEVCGKDANKTCEDCTVHYCSIICQAKDWPAHSKTCTSLNDRSKSISQTDVRGGGDARCRNTGLNNGFGSEDFNKNTRSRENLYNDNRFEEKQPHDDRRNNNNDSHNRFGDKRMSRFNDAQNEHQTSNRSRHNMDRSGSFQNNKKVVGGQKNMFEERKSRYLSDKPSKRETENEDSWDVTEPEEKNQSQKQNQSVANVIRSDVKEPSHQMPIAGKHVESAANAPSMVIEMPIAGKHVESAANPPSMVIEVPEPNTSSDLIPGVKVKVAIVAVETPGLFYVQLLSEEWFLLNNELNSQNAAYTPYTPLLNGICVSMFEKVWCRCKVTSTDPLTVHYIDYGNSETLTADKLFTLPEHLASKPPVGIKVKLAPGTPAEFFNKKDEDIICIKIIKKVDDYWEVEVDEVCNLSAPSECPSESNSSISQDRKEATQIAGSAICKLLPSDVFTEVRVSHKDSEYLAVVPVIKEPELQTFSARLQREAAVAAPITPALTKCLALCPVSNRWYRGLVVTVDPLHVKFVDVGVTQSCDPANLREVSSDLTSVAPYVVYIKPKDGSMEELSEQRTFSVKPLHKENGCWVVEVALSKEKEEHVETTTSPTVTTEPSVSTQIAAKEVEATYPEFLNKNSFTSVLIVLLDEGNNPDGDTVFVAKLTFWDEIAEMIIQFLNVSKNVLESPQIGDIGLALYQDNWYRVKVVSLSPLRVFYMDFGNTETLNSPGELFICPDNYKDLSPLVCKVQLASGTNKKYFNLKDGDISIKPVSVLSDGTIVVHVEGEVYSESTNLVESGSEQLTTPPEQLVPQVPVPVQEVQSPQSAVETATPNIVNENAEPKSIVDLLEEGYDVNFVPNKIDLAREILFGQLFCKIIPETAKLALDEEYEHLLNKEPHDPDFKPKEGELVLAKKNDEWQRAKVFEVQGQKWFSLVDSGEIVRHTECKRLPQTFSSIPLMAVVLKLTTSVDLEQLKILQAEADIEFKVVKVGSAKCLVQGKVADWEMKAKLEKWCYEPLVYPLPFENGDLVTIATMIKSNIVAVVPADDHVVDQAVQVESKKLTCKEFQVPPQIGDYVVFEDEDVFHRARVESIDSVKNVYTLKDIDLWYNTTIDLANMQPMPPTLYNLPCRATPVVLQGVRMLETSCMSELAQLYIKTLVEDDKPLKIELDQECGLVKLITVKEGQLINKKLEEHLEQKIVPSLNGKFMFESIIVDTPPLNEELTLVVTQSDPLYVQNLHNLEKFGSEVYEPISAYGNSQSGLYNPCKDEICVVHFDNEWYRALCLQERNTGINTVMLLDYGNIMDMPTSKIRKIHKDLLTFPIVGIACKVIGLPDDVTPTLRERLNEILAVDSQHKGIFEYKTEGHYYVNLPSVLTMLKVEGLVS